MGYLLPWGNMSLWGAQVIISLFGAIPFIGDMLTEFIRGDFVVGDATLNRFFALHVIAVPLALAGLVFVHIVALHKVGSNNPDGIEIKENKGADGIPVDGIPFHPYYTVKDIVGTAGFLILYFAVVFFAPEFGGWFLEADNFTPANLLKTPAHIVPLWYFTPYYSLLRASTEVFTHWWLSPMIVVLTVMTIISIRNFKLRAAVIAISVVLLAGLWTLDAKFWGVVLMGMGIVLFAFLPWLDRSPAKSIRYRGWMFKTALTIFVIIFVVLGYLGTQPAGAGAVMAAQVCTILYLLFFLLMPWYTTWDKTKPVPERVTK